MLIASVNYNNDFLVDFCLEHECDINAFGKNGCTALHIAAFCGRINFVRKLLIAGADETMKDNRGNTALQIAVDMKRQELVDVWETLIKETAVVRIRKVRSFLFLSCGLEN